MEKILLVFVVLGLIGLALTSVDGLPQRVSVQEARR